MPLISRLRSLRRDTRGNVMIEFALIAPLLLLLMFAIIEYSMALWAGSLLDNATLVATRYGITGDTYEASSRRAQILNSIKQDSSFLLDPSKIVVKTTSFTGGYGGLNAGATTPMGATDTADDTGNNSATSAGAGCAPILYDVSYPWKFVTPFASIANYFLNGRLSNTLTLRSTALVRNEAFSSPGGTTRCLND